MAITEEGQLLPSGYEQTAFGAEAANGLLMTAGLMEAGLNKAGDLPRLAAEHVGDGPEGNAVQMSEEMVAALAAAKGSNEVG